MREYGIVRQPITRRITGPGASVGIARLLRRVVIIRHLLHSLFIPPAEQSLPIENPLFKKLFIIPLQPISVNVLLKSIQVISKAALWCQNCSLVNELFMPN